MLKKIGKLVDWIILQFLGDPNKNLARIEKLYNKKLQERKERFSNFDELIKRIKDEYKYLENKQFPYFGRLYFDEVDVEKDFDKAINSINAGVNIGIPEGSSLKLVQIHFGHTPCGIMEFTKEGNVKGILEEGGFLSFSQSATGHVSIFIFPRASNYIKREEEFIIYKLNKDPRDIGIAQIRSAIRFFLYYVTTSSVSGTPSFWLEAWVYMKKISSGIRFSHMSSLIKEVILKIPSFIKK